VKEIHGVARSVAEILKGAKYSPIDYYQRDYKWEENSSANSSMLKVDCREQSWLSAGSRPHGLAVHGARRLHPQSVLHRAALYEQVAQRIWNPDDLLLEELKTAKQATS
jgi:hypothetical protein